MNNITQLIMLSISLLYGLFVGFLVNKSYKIYQRLELVWKLIFPFLFAINVVLIFLAISLKINKGTTHIYFVMLFLVGYFFSVNKRKKIL